MLIKKLLSATRGSAHAADIAQPDFPLEIESHLTGLHSRAPVRKHLDVLLGDFKIGDEPFVDLYFRCLEHTGTVVTPFNVFQRFQTRRDLLQYFFATLDLPGARIECGAYRGATALLFCEAWRSRCPEFTGDGFFLLDSFSGTSTSSRPDHIPVRDQQGEVRMAPFFPPRQSDVKVDDVRSFFGDYPRAQILEGWIPDVFSALPETAWAFVHIDLTLFEATRAALEHFYPRLTSGGVLIVDGSLFCPGAQKAVDDFASAHGAPYVALGHREAVFIKA